jgi:hypothetical protein
MALLGVHKKPWKQKLLEITPAFSDRQIAMMVAERQIETTDKPFRFSINHDIRPPGNKACPLSHYDWTKGDRVGIDTKDVAIARRWLTSAVLKGYTVRKVDAQYNPDGFPSSLEIARIRADYYQNQKASDDDDIPF